MNMDVHRDTVPMDAGSIQPAKGSLAIRAKRLINPRDQTILDNAVLVIDEGRFTYVGTNPAMIPPTATVLDWGKYTALPGFVDAHTHLSFQADMTSPAVTPWQRMWELSEAELLTLMRSAVLASIRRGVTTMIDKGSASGLDFPVRDEIAAGTTPGPRLFTAGPSRRSFAQSFQQALGGRWTACTTTFLNRFSVPSRVCMVTFRSLREASWYGPVAHTTN